MGLSSSYLCSLYRGYTLVLVDPPGSCKNYASFYVIKINLLCFFLKEPENSTMASNSVECKKNDGCLPSSGRLSVLFLASEWGSSKGGLSTINRELAINIAKHPKVDVTFYVPRCNDEDKKAALLEKINLVGAKRVPGLDELHWLSYPPENLYIDVVVGHGVKLGPYACSIRGLRKCKWVQVVHTVPE